MDKLLEENKQLNELVETQSQYIKLLLKHINEDSWSMQDINKEADIADKLANIKEKIEKLVK